MQHQRTYSMPYERRRCIEAAVLALVLTEDWPWQAGELAQRLRIPEDVIGLSTATLHADGLLVSHGENLRASWAAVRGDELLRHAAKPRPGSIKRRVFLPTQGAARLLPYRHRNGGDSAPNR
jgi:hypothetical protein